MVFVDQEVAKCFALNKIYKYINQIYGSRIKWSVLNGIISRWMMKEIGMCRSPIDPVLPTGEYIDQLISDLKRHVEVKPDEEHQINKLVKTSVKDNGPVGRLRVQEGSSVYKFCLEKPRIELSLPTTRAVHLKKYMTPREIFVLLLRYHTLNSLNNQLAVPPELYKNLLAVTPIHAELFASALNVNMNTPMFCSLFPDIEGKRGSKGSFFSINPPSGVYFANPPYDEEIMEAMARKLVSLCSSERKYMFISLLPVWDKAGILKFKGEESKWGEFVGFELMSKSKFCKKIVTVPHAKAKFFNYSTMEYICPCNIHVVFMSNMDDAPVEACAKVFEQYYGCEPDPSE